MSPFHHCLRILVRPCALGLLLAACGGTAHAGTWTVDTTSADPFLRACSPAPGDCSFPGAVSTAATTGDSIVFAVNESLAGEVEIGKDLVIEAAGARLPRLVITTRGIGWATVTVRNARWENRDSGGDSGGALRIARNQIVTIEDSVFQNSRTTNQGGAIFNEGELVVRRSLFEGNFSLGGGAAIHSTSLGTLTAIDSTFRRNGVLDPTGPGRQLGRIGAISAERGLDVRGCLFHDNESRFASAIWSDTLTRIYNSTFTGNRSFEAAQGGTLFLAGPTRIANSTIVGNSGSTTGGLFVQTSTSDTQVVNTIIANNLGGSPDIFGRIYTYGNNLIRTRGSAQIDIRPGNTNIESVDPGLAPLANNGGPTLTMQVPPNSPAHNAGSDCVLFVNGCDGFPHLALGVDQRGSGYARSRGGAVDIGAYELSSVAVSNSEDGGPGSLRQAIADASPGDVVTFSASHFSQPRTIALASTLVVNKTLAILGPGADLLTLDANNLRRHLNVEAPATLNLSGMRFIHGNPGANADGGAILVDAGTLNASDIRIENSGANGGGCLYNNGTTELSRVRLSGCQANYSAGLFNAAGRSATIRDSRIENNIASGPGGGIGNPSGATLVLERVSLSGNRGTIGGALNSYGAAMLSHSTFSGNTAENGGAMYLGGTGTTTLTHATVTANTAQFNGGIAAEFDAIVNLRGTLIAGNTRAVAQAPDAGGNFVSFGYNLIGDPFATAFRPTSPSLVGNILGAPARLAALADNGGHSLTHAPLHDSPIIDAGGAGSSVDARGRLRPIDFTHIDNASGGNGSDIGAFELQVATPTAVTATPRDGALSVAFTGGSRGGLAITGYVATCGSQSQSGSESPLLVTNLTNGIPMTCTVIATSDSGTSALSAPSASVAPQVSLGFSSAAPAAGQVRVMYSHSFVATGAPAPTYALESGSLPPGLSLDAGSGILSGTPTTAGAFAARIRASASGVLPATQDITITVAPNVPLPPAIGTASAGDGQVIVTFTPPEDDGGLQVEFYNAICTSLVGYGTGSPITVSPLPNGVAQSCRVIAVNALGASDPSAFANTVVPRAATALALSSSLNPALPGQAVTFTATVTPAGATGEVSFDTGTGSSGCASAALVAGIATCTTTYVGAGTRWVTAAYAGDAVHSGSTTTLAEGQQVDAPNIAISGTPAGGTFGSVYSALTFNAAGGVAPYSWEMASGDLPPGLSLGADGELGGTPTAAGTYGFSVRVTDAGQSTATSSYTVIIARAAQSPLTATASPTTIRVGGTSTLGISGGSGSGGVSYAVTAGVSSCTIAGGTLTGLATGTCTVTATKDADANHESASATVVIEVQPAGTDLGVSKNNGRNSVLPDSVVEYEILVANAGPMAVQGARVHDPVPAGLADVLWTCTPVQGASCPLAAGTGTIDQRVDLPVAAVLRYVFSARVVASAGATLTNTASVEPPEDMVELDPADNTASDTDAVVSGSIHRDGFESPPPTISVPLRAR